MSLDKDPDFSGVTGSGSSPDFSGVTGGSSSTAPGARPAGPRTHTVAKGENLSKIAQKYYANDRMWRKIYDANKEVIGKNPDLIKPGQVLTIPDA